jgi:GNAT superfamily N-acetyltransferase
VAVRPASPDDLAEVVRLRIAFIADVRGVDVATLAPEFATTTDEFLRDRAHAGRLHSWLATASEGGPAVGLVSVLVTDAPPLPEELRSIEGYVVNMFVEPEARRRGHGRALLDAVLTAAPGFGLRRLWLHSTDDGRPLYEATGFASDPRWMARRLPLPGAPEIRT